MTLSRTGWLLTPVLFLFPVRGFAAEGHTKDSLETVRRNISSGKAILVDVREKAEWDAGHIKGACLVPLSRLIGKDGGEDLVKGLDKKKVLYIHCAVGKRALMASEALKEFGFEVRPLKQGYQELLKSGFEKEK
ncbi:MAG TPA: rhodanese-like domain-containing protein [Gemmataceae bacterium]